MKEKEKQVTTNLHEHPIVQKKLAEVNEMLRTTDLSPLFERREKKANTDKS